MSLTSTESALMEQRDTALKFNERAIIDAAFKSMYEDAKSFGIHLATDDRAAKLEAAMVRFILDSRP